MDRMRWAVAMLLVGCYQPSPASDVPCSPNGSCPGTQVCDASHAPPICVDTIGAHPDAPRAIDAPAPPIDGPVMLGPWHPPTLVVIPGVPAGAIDDPTLTDDMLELYFNLNNDIYVTTRASATAAWGPAVLATALDSPSSETTPEISGDGLTMYFASDRAGGLGATDVWVATRPSRTAAWSTPVAVAALNSAASEVNSAPAEDGRTIVLASNRGGAAGDKIYRSTRPTTADPWSAPVLVAELNSATSDLGPMLTANQLGVYFESTRSGNSELWVAHRVSVAQPFDAPVQITELASPGTDGDPWISPDERHLYFASDRNGTSQLFESTR